MNLHRECVHKLALAMCQSALLFPAHPSLLLAHRCLERRGPRKWSSTIALMLWCLQGGVRAAVWTESRIQAALWQHRLVLQTRTGKMRANTHSSTHTLTGVHTDSIAQIRERRDSNTVFCIILQPKALNWLRAWFLANWPTLWLVFIPFVNENCPETQFEIVPTSLAIHQQKRL